MAILGPGGTRNTRSSPEMETPVMSVTFFFRGGFPIGELLGVPDGFPCTYPAGGHRIDDDVKRYIKEARASLPPLPPKSPAYGGCRGDGSTTERRGW